MSVLIGSWEFEGPYNQISDLRNEPGILAVLARENDELELIHMDESESVKDYMKVQTDSEKKLSHYDSLETAVYYCSDLNATLRQGLINKLMKEFDDIEES